ncbi:MAG: hypothetical protein ACI88H_000678 [Cocleimonas sp.]|jgi:hypothetical protein
MDNLTFVSKIIDSAVWPVLVLSIIVFLKKPISALLPRVKKVTHKDTAIDFSVAEEKSKKIENESEKDDHHINELKSKLVESEQLREDEKEKLTNEIIKLSKKTAHYNNLRKGLQDKILEPKQVDSDSIIMQELSDGRKMIVRTIVHTMIGKDKVLTSSSEKLINIFHQLAIKIRNKTHTELNGGALTGLRSVGIIDGNDKLTSIGVSVLKSVANES